MKPRSTSRDQVWAAFRSRVQEKIEHVKEDGASTDASRLRLILRAIDNGDLLTASHLASFLSSRAQAEIGAIPPR